MAKDFAFVVADACLVRMASPPRRPLADEKTNSKWDMPLILKTASRRCLEHILRCTDSDLWISNLSDVWFLQGMKSSNTFCSEGDKRWDNVLLNARQAEQMENDGMLVIAMALVTEHESYVEVDLIESHVPHCGAARGLMYKLEDRFGKPVIPTDVSQNLAYWSKRRDWLVNQLDKIEGDVPVYGLDLLTVEIKENAQKRICL